MLLVFLVILLLFVLMLSLLLSISLVFVLIFDLFVLIDSALELIFDSLLSTSERNPLISLLALFESCFKVDTSLLIELILLLIAFISSSILSEFRPKFAKVVSISSVISGLTNFKLGVVVAIN